MFKKYIHFIALAIIFTSCTQQNTKQITAINDYDLFLKTKKHESLDYAKKEIQFWKTKYEKAPNQVSYLQQLAIAHTLLFECNGTIEDLKNSEELLLVANERTRYKKVGLLHALSKNYSTQHRFKEALELLKIARSIGEKQRSTHKMLFDVYLELGDDLNAEMYLQKIKNEDDFDYLIRLSKWLDHKGNLTAAIRMMEKATKKAELINDTNLLLWSYSNLADFYGHAGNIEVSYQHYLKALTINPDYTYALRGIAWIVFSYENNPAEALRIIDAIALKKLTPDLLLLKADILAFQNNRGDVYIDQYFDLVANKKYGDMYNNYTAAIYVENTATLNKALEIAQQEIKNRATPQSYDLLAWVYHKKGDSKKALSIVQQYIENKTFEPSILYHMAEIYKANNLGKLAMNLKKELLESAFELGPLESEKIYQL